MREEPTKKYVKKEKKNDEPGSQTNNKGVSK